MRKCLIIGGGFAGLSAGVFLAEKGVQVTVLEASPKFGGRAYSFNDDVTRSIIDNGQHIFSGAYRSTIRFLKLIEAWDNYSVQNKLSVEYSDRKGNRLFLTAKSKFYPFNLLSAILNFPLLSFSEKTRIILFFMKIVFCNSNHLRNETALDWLKKNNQNESVIRKFWHLIVVSTLNESPENVSAEMLCLVIKRLFLRGNKNTGFFIAKEGLSECYIQQALAFVKSRKGELLTNERVIELTWDEGKILKVITSRNVFSDFDFVISAIPHHVLKSIDTNTEISSHQLDYSPIITIHIWSKHDFLKSESKFIGLINSKFDWIFKNGEIYSIVKSAAREDIQMSKNELLTDLYEELAQYFPLFNKNEVYHFRVIKEKRATFVPNINCLSFRKKIPINKGNLFYAGDWVNTGLPSTIESAVISSEYAVSCIMNRYNKKNIT